MNFKYTILFKNLVYKQRGEEGKGKRRRERKQDRVNINNNKYKHHYCVDYLVFFLLHTQSNDNI